jgi:probable rRNA maturation factor
MIYPQINDPYTQSVDASLLEQAAQAVLDHQKIPTQPDLSIVITNNEDIQALNKEFMDIDAPTDVLSFPSDELDLDTGNRYLGDVIISYPQAEAQSQAEGHTTAEELQLLVVHGVLHLLGYDHADEEQKKQMWSAQSEILAGLNNPLNRSYSF